MPTPRRRLPSPAILVAIAAMVMATAGIASAGGTKTTVRTAVLTIEYSNCSSLFSGLYSCTASGAASAKCKRGERATGGGYSKPNDTQVDVIQSAPKPAKGTPAGWSVEVLSSGVGRDSATPAPSKMPIHVVCSTA